MNDLTASRKRIGFCAAFGLAWLCLGSANASEAQPENSAAEKILPPEPGREACYRKVYDAQHLRAHPQQKVTEMTFLLRVEGQYATGGPVLKNPDHVTYNFALSLKRRDDRRPLRTTGDCLGHVVAECVVDCDGGGVDIEDLPRGGGLTLRLLSDGIAFGNDCDTTRGYFVKPGADDKEFQLEPAPLASCVALEKNEFRP